MWSGMMQGISYKRGTEMNPFKSKNQKRIHPTEKPFEIYKYLFSKFCSITDNIFDSHGGSFSSVIVADKMGLDITVCEIYEKYFKDGVHRYNEYKRQLTLNL
jgi:site-specific DNA-methyltransferase (adenine-specific)